MSEINFQNLHTKMMYFVFCIEFGKQIVMCETYSEFRKFIDKASKIHCGD